MDKKLWKLGLGWGFVLWLIGYVLGILLFAVVPTEILGWVIMPMGMLVTLWVLLKKIRLTNFTDYVRLGVVWTVMAIVLDYLFLVQLFKPADGYYKLDVYLYYAFTLAMPLMVGWFKTNKQGV